MVQAADITFDMYVFDNTCLIKSYRLHICMCVLENNMVRYLNGEN